MTSTSTYIKRDFGVTLMHISNVLTVQMPKIYSGTTCVGILMMIQ